MRLLLSPPRASTDRIETLVALCAKVLSFNSHFASSARASIAKLTLESRGRKAQAARAGISLELQGGPRWPRKKRRRQRRRNPSADERRPSRLKRLRDGPAAQHGAPAKQGQPAVEDARQHGKPQRVRRRREKDLHAKARRGRDPLVRR